VITRAHIPTRRAINAGLLAAVVALAILLHPWSALRDAGGGTSAPATSAMNGWSLYGLTPAQLDAQLAAMQSQRVRVLRSDATWGSLQPQAPVPGRPGYDFSRQDAQVAALAAHHITWLPILDYSAPWAARRPGDWRSPPADPASFAAYAGAVAARYGVGGSFWTDHPSLPNLPVRSYEVWNEENGTYFWDTGPDPAAYARLYLAAHAAIHRLDPGARVAVGGLIASPAQGIDAARYLAEMVADVPALRGRLDAVGLHPYADSATGVVAGVVSLRRELDGLGDRAIPIEVTEFGWRTGPTSLESRRATMMRAVATSLGRSDCGVSLLAPYTWETPAGTAQDGDWGLVGTTGLRPAGRAWFAALHGAPRRPAATTCASLRAHH
jgi:hypothetical protein